MNSNLCASVFSVAVAIVSISVLASDATNVANRNDSLAVAVDDGLMEFSDHTVAATYHYYRPKKIGWDMMDSTVSTYCSTWDANKPLSWRSRYGWTGYCRPSGKPLGQSVCGRCLEVLNLNTGASRIARIVDQCQKPKGGMDLDYDTVFKKIDTNEKGVIDGHLHVKFTFVSC